MDREAILRDAAEDHLLQEAGRRRFLYKDVEELITNGFLRHHMNFGGCPVTFRSLLPQDVMRIGARASGSGDLDILRWSLATSLWMVEGFELPLDHRENAPFFTHREWARNLHKSHLEHITVIFASFQNRISRAVRLVEAFCYEPYSRSMWRMHGRPTHDLDNANIVRRLWVAHNLAEDIMKADERDWQHTRAFVSSQSSKGGKHLGRSLDQANDKEENRRRRVIEDAVNWIIQGDRADQEKLTVMVNGKSVVVPRIHSAQTVEDLEEEMRRVFSGEKDFHDMLVDEYHRGIRERVQKQREERRQAILEARRRAEEAEERGAPPLVGYTKEQLEEINPRVLEQRTTKTVSDNDQAAYLYERYFHGELRPGVLTTNLTVEDPEKADLPTPEEDLEPKETLQQRIARRKPTLKGG